MRFIHVVLCPSNLSFLLLCNVLRAHVPVLVHPIRNSSHPDGCAVYPFEILICLSLMRNDVEHFLMYMGQMGISGMSVYA